MNKGTKEQPLLLIREQEIIKEKTFSSVVDKLYRHAFLGTICGFLAATLFYCTLLDAKVNLDYLNLWYGAIGVGYIFTLIIDLFYRRRAPDSPKIKIWFFLFGFIFIYFGLIWGSSALFLKLLDNLTQSFLILFLFGIAGALIQATIGTIRLGIITVILLSAPMIYWCLIQSNSIIERMGYIAIPFIGFLIFSQIVNTKIFKQSQRLSFELDEKNKRFLVLNEELDDKNKSLAGLNIKLNQLNEHLEEKVEERTKELAYQASHDVVTGLPNRLLLEKSIVNFLRISKGKFGLILISFKKLSSVNANFTHQIGDNLMKNIAEYFKEQLKIVADSDLMPGKYNLFHIRENVFAILIQSLDGSNLESTIHSVTKFCRIIHDLDGMTFDMPISIGASLFEDDFNHEEDFISNGEIALDVAEKAGNYNYKIYDNPLRQKSRRNIQIANDILAGLQKNEFYLHYQPLCNMQSGEIIGCEALARWNHPKLKVAPDEFIYIAEETSRIHALGEWVLKEACQQAKLWHDAGFHIKISVNVSPKQIEGNFLGVVENALEITGFDPSYLQLEITENENILKDEEKKLLAIETILQLKKLGIRFAMDDFGVGYSNISYLRQLGVTNIKFDKSMVNPLDEHNKLILKALIIMLHSLGLTVTCEGIDSYTKFEFLKENSCDIGQGFLEILGKSVSALEFTELLHARNKRRD